MSIDEEMLQYLCDEIQANHVIPVIGFDLLNSSLEDEAECISPEDKGTDLLTRLAKAYDNELCSKIIIDRNNRNNPIRNGYELLNEVYHRKTDRRGGFGVAISRKIVELRNNLDRIPIPFEQLAKIKGFRFYINATFLNSLEYAISTYKVPLNKDEQNYEVVNYNPRILNDIIYNYSKNGFSTKDFAKPTIYNLLGSHDAPDGEFVITEVDYMELLVKMISNEQRKFTKLKSALKDKDAKLLFIGCDFPDWIFRFFVRFCVDSKMDDIVSLQRNYLIEQLDDEPNKTFFISSNKISKFRMRPSEFVNEIFNRLKQNSKDNIEESYYNHPVFISYNHKDHNIAEEINKQLNAKLVDTWFDRDGLSIGDDLDIKIQMAIDNACIFLPIITNNVYCDTEARRYYKKEWNYAVQSKGDKIKPVRTIDFNNHTFPDNIFKNDTKKLLIEDGLLYEPVGSPDYKLSEKFIIELKELQYKRRTGRKNQII